MALNPFKFKANELVKIADDISITNEWYQTNSTMKNMSGQIFPIQEVVNDEKIKIRSYYWHPKDLIPISDTPAPIQEIVVFDPENLIL
jgi:hypothetical protein